MRAPTRQTARTAVSVTPMSVRPARMPNVLRNLSRPAGEYFPAARVGRLVTAVGYAIANGPGSASCHAVRLAEPDGASVVAVAVIATGCRVFDVSITRDEAGEDNV